MMMADKSKMSKPVNPRFAIIHAIIAEEALRSGFETRMITGHPRTREIIEARHRAIWRAWNEGVATYKELGRIFGDRDHTTIMSAVKKMKSLTHEATMLITFCSKEMAVIEEEIVRRDKAVTDTGLGIDMSGGGATRLQRQRAGVMGEAAVIKYLQRNIAEELPTRGLDGGIDLLFGPRREWSLAIKASVHEKPKLLYASQKGAIKADAAVLVATVSVANGMRIVGWERRWWIDQVISPQIVGDAEYMGVSIDGLLHPAALLSVDRGEKFLDMNEPS